MNIKIPAGARSAQNKSSSALEVLARIPVSKCMSSTVHFATLYMTVREAMQTLIDKHLSGMPLVNSSQALVSVVSEFDLMKLAAVGLFDAKLGEVLEKLTPKANLFTVDKDASLKTLYTEMTSRKFRRVVVTSAGGKVEGIVSRRNMIKAMAEHLEPAEPKAA